jgi:hypothetical protein
MMINPDGLRAHASHIREIAQRPRRRGKTRAASYLLSLAVRFEEEASVLEERCAGDKPNVALPQHPEIDLGLLVGVRHNVRCL